MAGDKETTPVPKFDGKNFSQWKFRVGLVLEEKQMKQFVEKDLDTLIAQKQKDTTEQELRIREAKCKSLLASTINDEQLTYIMDKSSAKEMYDALMRMFERTSLPNQVVLRHRLFTMKYKGGEMSEYLLEFDKVIRELRLAGAKLEELDSAVILISTLPNTFEALTASLLGMDETKLTLDYVRGRLLDEYVRKNGGTTQSKTNEAHAMQAKNPNIVCFNCGKKGHKKFHCRSKKVNKSNVKSSKNESSANSASNEQNGTLLCTIRDDEITAHNSNNDSDGSNGVPLHSSTAQTVKQAHALKSTSDDPAKIKFVLDSGATDNMVNNKAHFDSLVNIDKIHISTAKKNEKIYANEHGNISIRTLYNGDTSVRTIQDVLYSKELKCNLMSIRKLTKKGFEVLFKGDDAFVSLNGKTIFVAHAVGNLYEVEFNLERDIFAGITGEDNLKSIAKDLWHFRLGHLSVFDLRKMINREMVDGMDKIDINTDEKFCESCVLGKNARLPFKKRRNIRSKRILEIIHTDVCGPISKPAYDGSLYFITFTDDFSRASMTFTMKNRTEVFDKFKEYAAMAESEHGCKISKLQADNGGEYISHEMKNHCKARGIKLSYTAANNPEMNGVAERLNRTLQEKALAMLTASGLDRRFWNEAVLAANYIRNRCPTSTIGYQFKNKTPAEIWTERKPNLSNMRIFGSICYNHIPREKRTKFQPKASKCIFMGYASNCTYRLWDLSKNKLTIGRNVTFNEKPILRQSKEKETSGSEAVIESDSRSEFDFGDGKSEHSVDLDDTGDIEEKFHSANEESIGNINSHGAKMDCTGNDKENINNAKMDGIGNISDENLRRSSREKKKPERYGESIAQFALSAQQFVENDPQTIEEAKQRDDWPEWEKAIESEYKSLIKSGTWTLCELPKYRKAISGKWVFKLKRKSNGDVDKYKARFVAKGFSQKQGFDFNETYAPVAKLPTLRILLAIANRYDMHVHQMDVKGAFLNGDLNEEIYMVQPEGFARGKQVCKLNKAIYGLKQASRMWNEKFHKFITRIGFKRCASDYCLYTKFENGIRCYILLYVDDLLIVCDDLKKINVIKGLLAKEFEMMDIGRADTFLGMHIEHDRENGTIQLSQTQYLKSVVRKFGMDESKSISTPIEKGLHLSADGSTENANVPYRELIGCLTYATLTTRPDLCAATNYFSRFQSNYTHEHFTHAKRILRYVQGTSDLKLAYRRNVDADTLIGYADSDWAGDKNDSKSTSGYVFKLFGNTVTWGTHKQSTVSQSSTEAEYVALAEAINEAEWIKQLIGELGIEIKDAIVIHEDNQSTIKVAQEPRSHKRMKHVAVKYNFVRETVNKGIIQLKYIPTSEQTADIMTKGLGRIQFVKLRDDLNLA